MVAALCVADDRYLERCRSLAHGAIIVGYGSAFVENRRYMNTTASMHPRMLLQYHKSMRIRHLYQFGLLMPASIFLSALGLLLEQDVVLERVGKVLRLELELQFEMGVALAKVSDLLFA